MNINVVLIQSGSSLAYKFEDKNFKAMGLARIQFGLDLLKLNLTQISSDSDVLWLKDPRDYFDRYKKADMLVAGEITTPTVTDDGLELFSKYNTYPNIGIQVVRPTQASKKFFQAWYKQVKRSKYWDQYVFNEMIREKAQNETNDKRLFRAYRGSIQMGILPVSMFGHGNGYFFQQLHEVLNLTAYSAHSDHIPYRLAGKRHRFREAKLWEDSSDYYEPHFQIRKKENQRRQLNTDSMQNMKSRTLLQQGQTDESIKKMRREIENQNQALKSFLLNLKKESEQAEKQSKINNTGQKVFRNEADQKNEEKQKEQRAQKNIQKIQNFQTKLESGSKIKSQNGTASNNGTQQNNTTQKNILANKVIQINPRNKNNKLPIRSYNTIDRRQSLFENGDAINFIQVRYAIPEDILKNAVPTFKTEYGLNGTQIFKGHFNLVNYQLTQMRKAFTISFLIERITILPKFWCGTDLSPQGDYPDMPLIDFPIACPADSIVNIQNLVEPQNHEDLANIMEVAFEDQQFKKLEMREYSFLGNSKVSDSIAQNQILISVCENVDYKSIQFKGGNELFTQKYQEKLKNNFGCDVQEKDNSRIFDGVTLIYDDVYYLPSQIYDVDLEAAFKDVKFNRLATFENLQKLDIKFSSRQVQTNLEDMFKYMASSGCCSKLIEGYIYYDMLHDQVPHVDQFGKNWTEPWVPVVQEMQVY